LLRRRKGDARDSAGMTRDAVIRSHRNKARAFRVDARPGKLPGLLCKNLKRIVSRVRIWQRRRSPWSKTCGAARA